MITNELYQMCKFYLSWYDDVISNGEGDKLTPYEILTAIKAEEVIKLWQKE